MSHYSELHAIIMQQGKLINKLMAVLPEYPVSTQPNTVAGGVGSLQGSDLVREYFRRGGTKPVLCFFDDISDGNAVTEGDTRYIVGLTPDGRFDTETGFHWICAVACNPNGAVLTASELLG